MNSEFYTFNFEVFFIFDDELTASQVESAYKKLISLKEFDGVKKVVHEEDKYTYARLTSKDNQLRLSLNYYGLSLTFSNRELKKELNGRFSSVYETAKRAVQLIGPIDFGGMRVRHLFFSASKKNQISVIARTINPALKNLVDDFELDLQLPDNKLSNISIKNFLSVTTNHTSEMHSIFDKIGGEEKALNELITFQYNRTILKRRLSLSVADNFFSNQITETSIENVLNRLENYASG